MIKNQEFANLQVFCDKERRVAKKVYEFLYKGFKTPNTNILCNQFGAMANICGIMEGLNADTKRNLNTLFNAVSSPPFFLRKYDDGWTSILHSVFCATNIASYALQYSQNTREQYVVALAYDNEQFLCAAFQDGEILFNYNAHNESKEHIIPDASEIATFAEKIGCRKEDVLRLIDAVHDQKAAVASHIFKHPVIDSAERIKPAERSLYIEVSGEGLWY